eukprot:Skav203131  [mRNA]  locus=scaffold3040:206619:208447:+ [translate_table: standard]
MVLSCPWCTVTQASIISTNHSVTVITNEARGTSRTVRTGAVYVSVPDALSKLMFEAVPCQLSKAGSSRSEAWWMAGENSQDIREALQKGQRVPDALVIEALRFRLLSPDALKRGWVLDDFPCTKAQAQRGPELLGSSGW